MNKRFCFTNPRLFLLLQTALSYAMQSCFQNSSDGDDWYELCWHDEFNGKTINDSIWSKMKRVHGARSIKTK
jgi:hypothetical protein